MENGFKNEKNNVFYLQRQKLGLTREQASELLDGITADRIEKIESGKSKPHPDEVLMMAAKYRSPALCNYFCSNVCEIGQKYVPSVEVKDLSQIVLEMLATFNSLDRMKNRLIDITADGVIDDSELDDFIAIQTELEHISLTVNSLKLWTEDIKASGKINNEKYNEKKKSSSK